MKHKDKERRRKEMCEDEGQETVSGVGVGGKRRERGDRTSSMSHETASSQCHRLEWLLLLLLLLLPVAAAH